MTSAEELDWEVRAARVEDADAMGEVMVESFLEAHRDHLPRASWEARRRDWTPEVSAAGWRRGLEGDGPEQERPCILVATRGAGVLGVAGASPRADDRVELEVLYVASDAQRGGIGAGLLREVMSWCRARGVRVLEVAVLTANGPARGFYERMGGQLVGEREFDEEGVILPQVVYAWELV